MTWICSIVVRFGEPDLTTAIFSVWVPRIIHSSVLSLDSEGVQFDTMFSAESEGAPNIAVITIVCGWAFTAVATACMCLLIWSRRISGNSLGKIDYLTIIAFIIAVILVIHTTWAVVDEKLGRNIDMVSSKDRSRIPRVRFSRIFTKM